MAGTVGGCGSWIFRGAAPSGREHGGSGEEERVLRGQLSLRSSSPVYAPSHALGRVPGNRNEGPSGSRPRDRGSAQESGGEVPRPSGRDGTGSQGRPAGGPQGGTTRWRTHVSTRSLRTHGGKSRERGPSRAELRTRHTQNTVRSRLGVSGRVRAPPARRGPGTRPRELAPESPSSH